MIQRSECLPLSAGNRKISVITRRKQIYKCFIFLDVKCWLFLTIIKVRPLELFSRKKTSIFDHWSSWAGGWFCTCPSSRKHDDRARKIHHEWRCMDPIENGGFSNVMLVFQGWAFHSNKHAASFSMENRRILLDFLWHGYHVFGNFGHESLKCSHEKRHFLLLIESLNIISRICQGTC